MTEKFFILVSLFLFFLFSSFLFFFFFICHWLARRHMQVKIPKQYQNLATVELVLKGVLLHALAQPRLQGFSLKKWERGWHSPRQ